MATIKKRNGANSTSYLIRVSCGYAADGTQVMRSMTWKPAHDMTLKQIEKELQRQAVLFEEQCAGHGASGAVKFETFAKQWFAEYADIKLRRSTLSRLHRHEARTYIALGYVSIGYKSPYTNVYKRSWKAGRKQRWRAFNSLH